MEGRLAEIRAAELSFTQEETATVLAVSGVTISDDALRELVRRTEGWPAAISLAALSLVDRPPGRHEADEFVRRLSGSDRFIADYLSEEVLARQERELRDFIVNMSVFDRFNAALANDAAQISSAARLLHRLERDNLFLIPLPDDGGTASTTCSPPTPGPRSRWSSRSGWWTCIAAAHAGSPPTTTPWTRSSTSWPPATPTRRPAIQQNWVRYLDAGRSATVTGWLQALHGTPADHGAAATVTGTWMAALTGDRAELDAGWPPWRT